MRKILLMLLIFIFSISSYAQSDPKLIKFIDSLFKPFNNTSSPGIAITVLQNGKVVAKKNYGMASLEHKVPFTHQSVVRFGYSDTREFMCVGLALMEQEGLLSFDDKVRKYFPKLPAWSETVTIQDLLNHSSGFDDEWATLLLTQQSMTNILQRSQTLELLYNQPSPQVKPHTGFIYSNSDFALLRMIMEDASGESLPKYLKKKLFTPLGMNCTIMEDNLSMIIPNLAQTYYGNGSYVNAWKIKTSPGGDYRIVTNANDIAKWVAACNNGNSFVSKAFERLHKDARVVPVLKNKHFVFGSETETINGAEVVKHCGVNGVVYATRIPSKKTDVIVMSNNPLFNVIAENITHYILNVKEKRVKNNFHQLYALKPVVKDTGLLSRYAGRYLMETGASHSSHLKHIRYQDVKFEEGNLNFYFSKNDFVSLIPVGDSLFRDPGYPAMFKFSQPHPDSALMIESIEEHGVAVKMKRVNASGLIKATSKEYLQQFTGKFYSKHLDYYFTIVLDENSKLILKRPTIADKELEPYAENQFLFIMEDGMSSPWNVLMKFTMDNNTVINGFDLQHVRLMHHRFDKIN
jgi:CubicO group peptidase (beta-lactamase class C family)